MNIVSTYIYICLVFQIQFYIGIFSISYLTSFLVPGVHNPFVCFKALTEFVVSHGRLTEIGKARTKDTNRWRIKKRLENEHAEAKSLFLHSVFSSWFPQRVTKKTASGTIHLVSREFVWLSCSILAAFPRRGNGHWFVDGCASETGLSQLIW